MRAVDVIFSLVAGRFIGFLLSDFLREWGVKLIFSENLILWIIFPFFSLFYLWLAYLIGKKLPFVFQAAKFLLVGSSALVVDLKIFELLVWTFSLYVFLSLILIKSVSFIFSTFLKYWGNKYWAFGSYQKENISEEIIKFFYITAAGLTMDIGIFYYLTKITGPQFGFPMAIWMKLSVILAGFATAIWNFSGYKFLVFKK